MSTMTKSEAASPAAHGTRSSASSILPTYARADIAFERGEGAWLIADDGRGVPEALAEQVFLPLVSGRAEGTGLGLALAQQVAREHRGSLSYRSRVGHTVFTVLLPFAAPPMHEHNDFVKARNDHDHV